MENRSHAWLAGLFVLALLAAAAVTAIWLGHKDVTYEPHELAMHPVGGLTAQSQACALDGAGNDAVVTIQAVLICDGPVHGPSLETQKRPVMKNTAPVSAMALNHASFITLLVPK